MATLLQFDHTKMESKPARDEDDNKFEQKPPNIGEWADEAIVKTEMAQLFIDNKIPAFSLVFLEKKLTN